MPNIHDCLQRVVDAGELDRQRAAEAGRQFDQLVSRYENIMPRHQAEATAAAQLKEATRRARRSRRHTVLNQLQAMTRLRAMILQSPRPDLALRNLIEYSEGSGFRGESVQSLYQAYVRSINGALNDVLRETGRNVMGKSRDPVLLRNLFLELHLEDSGDPRARALAAPVVEQQNRMVRQFNAHGGDIKILDGFGVSHSHDPSTLRKAGFDAWADFIAPRNGPHLVDWSKVDDARTGKPFATGGRQPARSEIERFLQNVYEGITERGWDDRQPSMTTGGKALYSQRADHRKIHFKGGSAWLAYNERFGTSDPFSALIGGLHGMARDVAMMRVLGPNPRAGLEYAIQTAQKLASTRKDQVLEDRVAKSAKLAKTMLAHIDGSVSVPEGVAMARFFGTTRKVLTSIQLGSATVSAVTDLATMRSAAAIMGMNPNNLVARQVKLLSSSASREEAARAGFVADTLADAGSTAARFTSEVVAGEFAERLSSFTMRASGLSFWTDMNRTAFQMEFAGYLASNAGKSFQDLPAPLKKLFDDRGITARDWDALRDPAAMYTARNGATFLSPIYWRTSQTRLPPAEAEGLAMRLQMLVEEQIEYAVPSNKVEGRARLMGQSEPGTFYGELLRSTTMYKSFSMSLMLGQYRRFMALPNGMARAQYLASFSVPLVLLGALAIQLKEIVKGNDPRPMDETKFWMAAVFQSGGLGIFGDFFSAETSRAGGGLGETIAGPVIGLGADLIGPVASNVQRAVEGKDTLIGRDVANLFRRNTPILSTYWPGRTMYDRVFADQLQAFLDPEAEAVWHRQMKRQEKDYGTPTYWRRGDLAPFRFPDFSNALGDAP